MANRRLDNNFLYIELWGITLQFDRTSYAIHQLSDVLELRIKNDSETIYTNRENGKPFEITYHNGKEAHSIVPCAWENINYAEETISTVGKCVNDVLKKLGFNLNPNWEQINAKWLEEVKRIERVFGDASGKATQAALQKQVVKYQQIYNEELAKDYGLSFGIVSSSIIDHMVYAAQSASKEEKDRKRAEKAADAAMQNSSSEITAQVYEVVYPLYIEKIEPALIKLLTEYYAYIVAIFSKELGRSFDEVANLFDMDASNEYLTDSTTDARSAVLHALQKNPDNGSVIGYAIGKGILDDELCAYGAFASEKFQYRVKEWAIHTLSKIHESSQMFNKPLVYAENKGIISGLMQYYKFVDGTVLKSTDWQDILRTNYKEELIKANTKFELLANAYTSSDQIELLAKEKKKIRISDDEKELFVCLCNELRSSSSCKIARVLQLELPVEIQEINTVHDSVNCLLDTAIKRNIAVEKQVLEKQMREKNELALKQQQKREKKKLMLRKISVTLVSVAMLIICGYFLAIKLIIPTVKYNSAIELLSKEEYLNAYLILSELGDFRDSEEQIYESKYTRGMDKISEGDFDTGIYILSTISHYKDAQGQIYICKYNYAVELYDKKQFVEAQKIFKEIPEYSDASEWLKKCDESIKSEKYTRAKQLYEAEDYDQSMGLFKALGDYSDSAEQYKKAFIALYGETLYNMQGMWHTGYGYAGNEKICAFVFIDKSTVNYDFHNGPSTSYLEIYKCDYTNDMLIGKDIEGRKITFEYMQGKIICTQYWNDSNTTVENYYKTDERTATHN